MNTIFYEANADGQLVTYDVFSRLVKERIVFLTDEIDRDLATELTATLYFLDAQSHDPITMYINSPGGTVSDGLLTIYDTMQFIHSPIKTVCIGEACSAAAVILSAGTPGMRYAYPNAKVMIHGVQVYMEIQGKHSEVKKEALRLEKLNKQLLQILADHTEQSLEKVLADCEDDKYFDAEEAIAYGLIDHVIPRTKKLKVNLA